MELKQIELTLNSYIIVWPGDDREMVLKHNGECVPLPACDEVAEVCSAKKDPATGKEIPGTRFKFASAIDPGTKKPIPGTVEIHDIYGKNKENQTVRLFDASAFVRHVASKEDITVRGIGITNNPANVSEIMKAGRPMWEKHIISHYEKRIRRDLQISAKYKAANQPVPPRPDDEERRIKEAVEGLKKFREQHAVNQVKEDELLQVLEGVRYQEPEEPEVTPAKRRKKEG